MIVDPLQISVVCCIALSPKKISWLREWVELTEFLSALFYLFHSLAFISPQVPPCTVEPEPLLDLRKGPVGVRAFAYATSALGVAVLAWAILSSSELINSLSLSEGMALLGVLSVACLSARWVVRVPRTDNYMAVADSLMLAVTMIYGIVAGVLANGIFYLVGYWSATRPVAPDQPRTRHLWNDLQAAFNMGAGAIYAFVFGHVFFMTIPDGPAGSIGAAQLIIPVLLMATAYFLVNSFLTDAVQTLAGRGTFGHLWLQNLPLVPLYFLAS